MVDSNSIQKAIEGATYVVHTASPNTWKNPKNEDEELIKPAVEGTLAVMRACQQYKVKRLVLTSSTDLFDDRMPNACGRSKILADKAASDFLEDLPNDEQFELVMIHAGLTFGPNINRCQFQSGDIVKSILLKERFAVPLIQTSTVDVRDVALAHL